jgi:hypothetical protein
MRQINEPNWQSQKIRSKSAAPVFQNVSSSKMQKAVCRTTRQPNAPIQHFILDPLIRILKIDAELQPDKKQRMGKNKNAARQPSRRHFVF